MPIHLPPISRRKFLFRSLLAGAGLVAGTNACAVRRKSSSESWALLADPHLAADPKLVNRSINMTEHFTKVTREILAGRQRPAGAFVVGDCAFNQGVPGDYAQVLKMVRPLHAAGLPVHLALGNHDQRQNFRTALQAEGFWEPGMPDRQVALISTKFVNWLLLDSLETTLQTPGLLGLPQLRWLTDTLDQNREKPAVLLIHHNPGWDGNFGLKDTAALLEILRPRPQVKAWVYGHTHNWKLSQDPSGIHLVNLPPVAYLFREGDPAGWVHATPRADGMDLELRSLDPKHPAHGQRANLQWRSA